MELIITNKYINRNIKITNIDYLEIIQKGSKDMGWDDRKLYIKYSLQNEPPLKFYELEISPELEKIKIIK